MLVHIKNCCMFAKVLLDIHPKPMIMKPKDHKLKALETFLSANDINHDLDLYRKLRYYIESCDLEESDKEDFYWILDRTENLLTQLKITEDLTRMFHTKFN